jgi:hypothetical protein
MFGCLDYNDSRKSYVSYLSDNKFASLDDAAASAVDSCSQGAAGSYGADVAEQSAGRGGDKKRTNGKQLVRKKWIAIRDDVDALLRALDSGDEKPSVVEVSRVLHEASSAESLVENPGETFVSSLNSDMNELAQVYNKRANSAACDVHRVDIFRSISRPVRCGWQSCTTWSTTFQF